ncbi:Outer membrane vitamin B12 receptor BtuB [hydrothermal vent metagenome]|uniref:Outer membrane vitamin B12 receptor BtuB n=1 Tax=hydrothermal vent metagenome TaxID=652676 RepID=A0A1W1BJR5_9ZZZZ
MTKISLSFTLSLLLLSNLNAENSADFIEQSGSIQITTANQSLDSITNTTTDVSVVTASQIEESGDHTVAQAISRVAGISVVGSGGFGQPSSIFMRGQSAGSVLILLDGMRLNDPSSTDGRAMLENIMTDNIAQIEIIKGGASSIWGSNASAGVINIITKSATKEGLSGSISLNGGSYSTKGANAIISYGSDKLTAQLMASYLDSDSFSALSPRDAENDYYTNRSYSAKLGYKFDDNNRVDLAYYYVDADGDYDDSFSTALANDTYSHYTATQENISLKYRYSSESFSSSNTVSQGTYDRDYYTNSYGEAQNQYRSTIKEISSINSYSYTQGKAILGLEAKDIDGMNNYISSFPSMPSQSTYRNLAIFISNSYNFENDTLLETNVRYDNFDEFDNKVTYKIGVRHNHDFLKGFTTRANYYTAYSSPSAYQLANAAVGELLKPSYSSGFDISANYKELLYITYFHTEIEDNIDYDMDRFGYYNVGGKEKFSGVEVSSKYRIANLGLVLGANLTHLITYESFDTTALSTRAKDTLNISADYFTTNGMHFGITGQYIGDRVDVSTEDTGNYTVWNLNFDMEIMKDLQLYVNAKNILDEEYESVYGYATEGRAIYAKLRYKF